MFASSGMMLGAKSAAPPPSTTITNGTLIMNLIWNPGYNTPVTSYQYMASQGVNMVRSFVTWEYLQTSLGGAFSTSGIDVLLTEISNAWSAGIKTVVAIANSGYYPSSSTTTYWGNGITTAQYQNFWSGLSGYLKGNPGVFAYDLMNEPNTWGGTLANGGSVTATFQQAALTAVRENSDNTQIWVEGYNWSGPQTWSQCHPTGFITDPANNFYYSFHWYPIPFPFTVMTGSVDYNISAWETWLMTNDFDLSTWGSSFIPATETMLQDFFNWCTTNNAKCTWGEFGIADYQSMLYSGLSTTTAAAYYEQWNSDIGTLITFAKNSGVVTAFVQHWSGSEICYQAEQDLGLDGVFVSATQQETPTGTTTIGLTTSAAAVLWPNSNWAALDIPTAGA